MVNEKHLKINSKQQLLSIQQCEPYVLIIGVICGSLPQILPLLSDIKKLSEIPCLKNIELYILANGEPKSAIEGEIHRIKSTKIKHVIILEGGTEQELLPIGKARSILQKNVGERMRRIDQSIAWIIDDDMRIPEISHAYLSWLPILRLRGADVIIGSFDGGSPNPAAHGFRVQLNDLLYNLNWLEDLDDNEELPDRSEENHNFRYKYPDYYYDLSRKHKKHLVEAYWLVPEFKKETVIQAKTRLLRSLKRIITGEPFLRPLITEVPCNPVNSMKASCNRGGNTFILNSKALTLTPNSVMLSNGKENRRSDMIWAIINRYYHHFNIYAVPFPLYHHRYVGVVNTTFQFDKIVGEVKGSSMYAALLGFFEKQKNVDWNFSKSEISLIIEDYRAYIYKRIERYRKNYKETNRLLYKIKIKHSGSYEVLELTSIIEQWCQEENLKNLEDACLAQKNLEISSFVYSLKDQVLNFSTL